MRDAKLLSAWRPCAAAPGEEAVEGHDEVVDVHSEVGVESGAEVDVHRHAGHDESGVPE